LQTEGSGCFSSDLLIIFWSLCRKAWEEKGVEMDIPFVEGSGFVEGWSAKDFGNVRWEFDTEVVLGAWVFYSFARGYWVKHRY
jgi:hypothetical protein